MKIVGIETFTVDAGLATMDIRESRDGRRRDRVWRVQRRKVALSGSGRSGGHEAGS